MAGLQKRSFDGGLNQPNITPLADVTTTLIVVFLITMPTIMWNGINVKQAEAKSEQQQVVQATVKNKNELVTIEVLPSGITLNGSKVPMDLLPGLIESQLRSRDDKTVIVVPSDLVELGTVVEVLDIAKESGAGSLALLNQDGGPRR